MSLKAQVSLLNALTPVVTDDKVAQFRPHNLGEYAKQLTGAGLKIHPCLFLIQSKFVYSYIYKIYMHT